MERQDLIILKVGQQMGQLLTERRETTDKRLEELRKLLALSTKYANDKACVYVTGSFARGEATDYSDLDLFIVGKVKDDGDRALTLLNEICIKADLIDAIRKLGIPDFSGDGQYLTHHTVKELVAKLGTPDDDAVNTFTARLLLLLESRPLVGSRDVYEDSIGDVITAYWRDYESHKADFIPAFLANDIMRLWRTFCVNYEARTSTDAPGKIAKRKLKNFKLKHSRLLTCYSGLATLLAIHTAKKTVAPDDAVEMVHLTPADRLAWIVKLVPGARTSADAIIKCYEQFLDMTNESEDTLVKKFQDRDFSRQCTQEANKLGDLVAELLGVVGKGSPLYRILIV